MPSFDSFHWALFSPPNSSFTIVNEQNNKMQLFDAEWFFCRTKFHSQLNPFKKILLNNDYPENFIGRCVTIFLNKNYIIKGIFPTFERKLQISQYMSVLNRFEPAWNYKIPLNGSLTVLNYRSCLKVRTNFRYFSLYAISKIFTSGAVYKFNCGLSKEPYCGICTKHLAAKSGKV